jgi:endonuclease/exonuclease/phosphatase family metal-dependent hydrolase
MEPMKQLETGSFMTTPVRFANPNAVRIVAWNINRGVRLNEVIEFLSGAAADLILLQEADWNARRTHGRNVTKEIAQALAMNYAFGCEFEELTQQHNGMPAYHGQATLSRFPLLNSRILRFHRQSRFWLPRWFIPRMRLFQRRVGGRMALISHIDLHGRMFAVYNVHLESRGDDGLRCIQLGELQNDAAHHAADVQIVVAGDFNADLRQEPFASTIGTAGLSNPFARISGLPTTVPSRFNSSRAIDWILTKGPLIASEPEIHESIRASDHYPLSLNLSDRLHETQRGRLHE